MRSISIATLMVGMLFPSSVEGGRAPELALNRMLFFFCSPLGSLGLCREYVIKSARERSKSADKVFSISELKAEVKGRSISGVKLPPFRASSNFLLTPSTCELDISNYNHLKLTHPCEPLGVKPTELALACKNAKL